MKIAIVRPHITEQTMTLAGHGWYTFVVDIASDKARIARDLGKLYNVTVVGVRTMTMHGKTRRAGKAMRTSRASDWKKAVIKLAKGQKIDAFDVAHQEGT